MTVAQPAASLSAVIAPPAGVEEPSRFTAYATGCTADTVTMVDRLFAPVERVLVPELSRISRRRVSPRRSRS